MNIEAEEISKAKTDPDKLSELAKQYELFILRCASDFAGKYITKSDDFYACALEGFVKAVDTYEESRGSFTSFARKVINNRLIDETRRQNKYKCEISVAPEVFADSADEDEVALRREINSKTAVEEDHTLKEEIDAANAQFALYGFSFFDLPSCSPKAKKTMAACRLAVRYLLDNPPIIKLMRETKCLPIASIQKNCWLPRKILERHRKYIIAVTEILSGEYHGLTTYLKSFLKEQE